MKHFTPLENQYNNTIDKKVYLGAVYGNCCSSSGINISNCGVVNWHMVWLCYLII